jgi:chaperonin GroES
MLAAVGTLNLVPGPCLPCESSLARCALELPQGVTTLKPLEDRIFVKVAEVEEKTEGGVLLPSSAQKRPTSGDVVSVGPAPTVTLKQGQTIIYSKFGIGVEELNMGGELYALLRERDVLGTMPRSGATVDDLSEIQPIADRLLVVADGEAKETKGGLLLTGTANEKPATGKVVRAGPGVPKMGEDGKPTNEMEPVPYPAGTKVVYFKYAGSDIKDKDGNTFKLLDAEDILGTYA